MRKKDLWISGIALLSAVILCFVQFTAVSPTISWGLSFRQEGAVPDAPAGVDALRALDAAFRKDTEDKVLYLTFDAGYENGCTEQILDVLKAHDVKAAFFLVGSYIEKNADLVRRMVEEGHIVGNHTMHHPDMSKLTSQEAFSKELQAVETLFQECTGQQMPKYYRPPQGVYSEENLKMAKFLGYKTVFWSLAYADWDNNRQPSVDYALNKLIANTHNGAIVLLHSTSETNAKIMPTLIDRWREMGYRFATLNDLTN